MTTKDRVPPISDADEENPQPGRLFTTAESLREAQAYAAHYIAAQLDRIRLAVRNLVVISALGILALFAAAAVVVTSMVLLCTGISGGLSRLYGGIPWLGDLSTAVLVIGVLAIAIKWFLSQLARSSLRQIVDAYERKKSRQRAEFGADVHERGQH